MFTKNRKKLSFCTTHLDRFNQISCTLPANLEDNRKHAEIVEFVVVDFIKDNKGELWDFVKKSFADDLKSGYLKYFSSHKMPYFHASIAKNTAHRLAKARYWLTLMAITLLAQTEEALLSISLATQNMCSRISFQMVIFMAITEG